jgi:hypothetical protein
MGKNQMKCGEKKERMKDKKEKSGCQKQTEI